MLFARVLHSYSPTRTTKWSFCVRGEKKADVLVLMGRTSEAAFEYTELFRLAALSSCDVSEFDLSQISDEFLMGRRLTLGDQLAQTLKDLLTVKVVGRLRITVAGCRLETQKKRKFACVVYTMIGDRICDETVTTPAARPKQGEVLWDKTFEFDLKEDCQGLLFEVYDERLLGRDSLVGAANIPLFLTAFEGFTCFPNGRIVDVRIPIFREKKPKTSAIKNKSGDVASSLQHVSGRGTGASGPATTARETSERDKMVDKTDDESVSWPSTDLSDAQGRKEKGDIRIIVDYTPNPAFPELDLVGRVAVESAKQCRLCSLCSRTYRLCMNHSTACGVHPGMWGRWEGDGQFRKFVPMNVSRLEGVLVGAKWSCCGATDRGASPCYRLPHS
eukprot:Rmarinus@m.27510